MKAKTEFVDGQGNQVEPIWGVAYRITMSEMAVNTDEESGKRYILVTHYVVAK